MQHGSKSTRDSNMESIRIKQGKTEGPTADVYSIVKYWSKCTE